MTLTPAQIAQLRAVVMAEPSLATAVAMANDDATIRAWCNAPSTFSVYRSSTSGDAVRNAIVWNRMTYNDPPDLTVGYTNRSLACQGFQNNLFMLTQGLTSIATGLPNIRAGLQDALSAVKTAITRLATNAEKVFATGTGTPAAPGDIVWEGEINMDQASSLR